MRDTFVMSARQAAELDYAFGRNGWTPADVKALSEGTILSNVLRALHGTATVLAAPEHLIDCDAAPFVPDGYRVEEHIKGGQLVWSPDAAGFYPADGQQHGRSADFVDGYELWKKLRSSPVLNANVLDYLLRPEHRHLIPEELKGKPTDFWGTLYRGSSFFTFRYIRCMVWRDGECGWGWNCLYGDDFALSTPVLMRARHA